MWGRPFMGTDVYHVIAWFILYSILGWFVESVYMSFCNHKITNRGFAKGPFCPIYGFGFVGALFILKPISHQFVLLYIAGAVLATLFEFIVARLMIRFLGEVWWDYNDKPFNYKGIICLESTIAWGFYTLFLFGFLQNIVVHISDRVAMPVGIRICKIVLVVFSLDFICQLMRALKRNYSEKYLEQVEKVKDRYLSFRTKF